MTSGISIFPRIKICGITRAEDALLAASLGAWAIGFVFYEKSPRAILPENAGKVIAEVLSHPDFQYPRTVGVFVNASVETIVHSTLISQINTVQLHGDESPEFCREVRKTLAPRIEDLQIIKAIGLKDQEELKFVSDYRSCCEAVLLDTYSSTHGGTGVVGNWEWAAQASQKAPIILAGGLNPENIRAAIQKVQPFAVDASSGLERIPGQKSPEKLREFFRRACETV